MPPCAGFLPSSFQQIFEGQHQALSRYLERHQISEATRLSLHICRVTRPESDDVYFESHFESFRAHFYLSLRYSCNCFRCGRGSVAGEVGDTLPHCHTATLVRVGDQVVGRPKAANVANTQNTLMSAWCGQHSWCSVPFLHMWSPSTPGQTMCCLLSSARNLLSL